MPLPDLLEIVPPPGPLRGEITVPGSKSITNRALVLAALTDGSVTLRGALWSEDTQVMVEALRTLGFAVAVKPDPAEFCNRTITVEGLGGRIPRAGTLAAPLELFVGNAGTAARFLAALLCLGRGVFRFHGVPRMHERPQAALFAALRELGYRVDSPNDCLPAVIHGTGPRAGQCQVSVGESSQFASALLLAAKAGGWRVAITGANPDEMPYVEMTRKLCAAFPARGGEFQVEPDASSGSYFWAAGSWEPTGHELAGSPLRKPLRVTAPQLTTTVRNWPTSGWQVDQHFIEKFAQISAEPFATDGSGVPPGFRWVVSRATDLGDSILTAIVLAPLGLRPVEFTDLGRLRVQECERVAALRTELTKCGAKVVEAGDTLTVFPSAATLHGAEIETYGDHRMAMCFAVLGLKVPGVRLRHPACVKKTFPNFFQKLAAPAPAGFGVELRDARTGQRLGVDDLFAD